MYDDGSVTSPDPAPPVRAFRPVRDIALSLGVLIVPLLLLMAFCQPSERDVPTVDANRTYQTAKSEAKFPVLVPGGLPDGWRATNAAVNRLDAGRLTVRVSYLTSSGTYLQLVQTDADSGDVILAELGAGKIQGSTDVRGVAWQRYSGRRPGETALVLIQPESTVVTSGDASLADLRTLAAALR